MILLEEEERQEESERSVNQVTNWKVKKGEEGEREKGTLLAGSRNSSWKEYYTEFEKVRTENRSLDFLTRKGEANLYPLNIQKLKKNSSVYFK